MKKVFGISWLLGLVIATTGCDDCSFTSRNHTKIAVKFYRRGSRQPLDVQFVSITTGVNKSIDGKPNSVINVSKTTPLLLPLHPVNETSTFYFRLNSTEVDSVTFDYRREFAIVSPRCGYDQRIATLQVKSTTFDSTAVLKSDLEIDDSLNVRLYLQ
jgi:hypothetical protein